MRRWSALAALLAAAVLLWTACSTSSTSNVSTSATTSSVADVVPPTAAPTPSTAAPTPTTGALPLVPQETPELAASMLLDAWVGGDRQKALQVATAAAVTTLFVQPAEHTTDRGCQTGVTGQSYCAFGLDAGGLVQLLTGPLNGGWLVESVVFDS